MQVTDTCDAGVWRMWQFMKNYGKEQRNEHVVGIFDA